MNQKPRIPGTQMLGGEIPADTWLDLSSFWYPQLLQRSAWIEHAPFAFWLVGALRPRTIVELGAHLGYSYFALCQAVRDHKIEARCYAVDSWKGDEHAGFYGEEVFEFVQRYNQSHYESFSELIRSTFDDASVQFDDGTIDLLHMDGRHYYDDVRHDFDVWRPKLSDRSVVLFHDTQVRERGFGVHQFWAELSSNFPSFEFLHGHGLGVLGYGSSVPSAIHDFFRASSDDSGALRMRAMYQRLGAPLNVDYLTKEALKAKEDDIARLSAAVTGHEGNIFALQSELARQETELQGAARKLRLQRAEINGIAQDLQAERSRADALSERLVARERTIEEIERFPGWRITKPISAATKASRHLLERALDWLPLRSLTSSTTDDAALIRKSGLFDESWYVQIYPDVFASGMRPLRHFLKFGAAEGRSPGPAFDLAWYRRRYPDVARARMNPLIHYLRHGRSEGRQVAPVKGIPTKLRSAASASRQLSQSRNDIGRASAAVRPAYQVGDARIAVYTAVVGPYDVLVDPHEVPTNCDFFVFTDQELTTQVWQRRPIPYADADDFRSARFIKLHPHLLFPEYELSIWIDANLEIVDDLTPYLDRVHAPNYISTWRHPDRSTVGEELATCIELNKDDAPLMREHLARHKSLGFPDKSGLFETSVMIRRHLDPRSIRLMTAWWRELCDGSRRDQLSLPFVLWQQGRTIIPLREDKINMRNDPSLVYHRHTASARPREIGNVAARTPTIRNRADGGAAVTIGICIHNSLPDVRNCLHAVFAAARPQDEIVLVDDGSEAETCAYLQLIAGKRNVRLIRNEQAQGYTRAANAALKSAVGDFIILLNSDTIPCAGFIEKLLRQGTAHPRIGIVGPMSNAGSWQSLPELIGPDGEFMNNPIPPGIPVGELDRACVAVADVSGPIVPLVNGFCFMIRRSLVQEVGLFDEVAFPHGYGEENDYCMRAQDAGYLCVIATDTFVYHAKSKSYGSDRKRELSRAGAVALNRKYPSGRVDRAVATMREQPSLAEMRIQMSEFARSARSDPCSGRNRQRLRVGCFAPGSDDQPNASTFIRLVERLEHAQSIRGMDYELLPKTQQSLSRLGDFDLIVVQRHVFGDQDFSSFALALVKCGVPIIYEVDDNLVEHPELVAPPGEGGLWGKLLQKLPMLAHHTIVSTEPLAEVYRQYSRHVHVVRNDLSERIWLGSVDTTLVPRLEFPERSMRFLYMGTYTHGRDLEILLPAFERVAERHPGIELCLIGVDWRADSPTIRSLDVPGGWTRYDRFVRFLRANAHLFNAAVAPLEDTAFTRCKSDLKFLEYSMLGLPGIYSKVWPYAGTVQHGVNGLLAENTTGSWVEAFEHAIANRDEMQAISTKAKHHVQEQRLLRNSIESFIDLLQGVATSTGSDTSMHMLGE